MAEKTVSPQAQKLADSLRRLVERGVVTERWAKSEIAARAKKATGGAVKKPTTTRAKKMYGGMTKKK